MENTSETKVCKRCGRSLPLSEFGRHHKTKDGYQPVCRECLSKALKGRKRNKAAVEKSTPDVDKMTPDDKKSTPDVDLLREFDDDDLFTELQRRGYKGTITHTVTL